MINVREISKSSWSFSDFSFWFLALRWSVDEWEKPTKEKISEGVIVSSDRVCVGSILHHQRVRHEKFILIIYSDQSQLIFRTDDSLTICVCSAA